MGVIIPDITVATGGLTTATDTSTRPDTATAIMAAGIAGKTAQLAKRKTATISIAWPGRREILT